MSPDRMWQPVFVDLENIIVVDKNVDVEDQPEDWTTNHTSEAIHCSNCFAFSSEKICQHRLSDHNHYAMCKFIEESILHPVPKSILKVRIFYTQHRLTLLFVTFRYVSGLPGCRRCDARMCLSVQRNG